MERRDRRASCIRWASSCRAGNDLPARRKLRSIIGRSCRSSFHQHATISPWATASHPNSEVKHGRAQVVLPSGRGGEGWVLHVPRHRGLVA